MGFVERAHGPGGAGLAVIAHDRLIVVAAPSHAWARRRRPLTAEELAATPLVLREEGSGTRQVLDAALGGLARPLIELSSTTAVKAAAVGGAGAGGAERTRGGEELGMRRLVRIPVQGSPWPGTCARSGPRATAPPARRGIFVADAGLRRPARGAGNGVPSPMRPAPGVRQPAAPGCPPGARGTARPAMVRPAPGTPQSPAPRWPWGRVARPGAYGVPPAPTRAALRHDCPQVAARPKGRGELRGRSS